LGALEIEAFLSHLAQEANVSVSTQNQAFNTLLFLYRDVLQIELATPYSCPAPQGCPALANGTLYNLS